MKRLTGWWRRANAENKLTPPSPGAASNTNPALRSATAEACDGPVICIVTPVFDGAEYIDDTIFSILSQAGDFYLHYHVQDGGSRDDTMERVRGWMERSELLPRLCRGLVFTCASAPDMGMYDAINRGFAAALPPGDDVLMAWIAADDRVAPGACATLAALRVQMPDARLLGGRIALLDHAGSVIRLQDMIPFSRRCMAAGLYDGRAMPFVMQEGTFWCADLWRKVGGLDTRFRLAGDWDLWRRMAEHATYVSVDGILGFHRRRSGQLSEQMDRYYEEVDAALDCIQAPPIAAAASAPPATGATGQWSNLRAAYNEIAVEQEAVRRDPSRFRVSQHVASAVRYNMHLKRWEWLRGLGAAPGAPKLVGPAGSREGCSVVWTEGFKPPEGPYPEYGLHAPIRWMSGPKAAGEVWLDEPGRYRIKLRCRSWVRGQRVLFLGDDKPLGRIAVTPYEHDRDLELTVDATFATGHHVIGLEVEQDAAGPFLLVMEWWVEQADVTDRRGLLPVPDGSIGLAAKVRGAAPGGWPRLSIVVDARDKHHLLRDTVVSIVRQGYPFLQLIVVDSGSNAAMPYVLRDLASHIDDLIVVTGSDEDTANKTVVGRATGDIFGWLRSGDLVADGGLHAATFAFLQSGADIVAGMCQYFDDAGKPLGRYLPHPAASSSDVARTGTQVDHAGHPVFFTRTFWGRAGGSATTGEHRAGMTRTGAHVETIGAVVVQRRHDSRRPTSEGGGCLRVVMAGTHTIADRRLAGAFTSLGHAVVTVIMPDADLNEAIAIAILTERPDLIVLGFPLAPGNGLPQMLVESGTAVFLHGAGADPATPIEPRLRIARLTDARRANRPRTAGDPEGRAAVYELPVGIDTQLFDPGDAWRARMLLDLPQDAFVVLTSAAEPGQAENLPALLAALDLLAYDDLILLVIGASAPVATAGLAVHHVGALLAEDLRVLHYQAADVFVVTDEDAFAGIVEAAACGVATIGGQADAAAGTIVPDLTGIVAETREPGALAQAIGRLRGDLRLRRSLGGAARLHAVNQHGMDACAARLATILATELQLAPPAALGASAEPVMVRRAFSVPAADFIDPVGWIPRTNLIEERRANELCGLPPRFWWAVPPECSFMVRAGRSGIHTLQLRIRNELPGRTATFHVNDGLGAVVDLAAEPFELTQAVQVGVDLDIGLNRIVVRLGGAHARDRTHRNLSLMLEDINVWPGRPLVGNEAIDGAWELIEGFGAEEGPYPDMALPNSFRWATATCCEVRVFSAASGRRRWVLNLRNNNPDQTLAIEVDGEPVGAFDVAAKPLHTLQRLEFDALLGVGFHTVKLSASRHVRPKGDHRSLAFIFEAIFPSEVAAQDPSSSVFAALPREENAARWLCASGFAAARDGSSLPARPHPVAAREAVIRFTLPIRHVQVLMQSGGAHPLVEVCTIEGELVHSWQPGPNPGSRLIDVRLLDGETHAIVLRSETTGSNGIALVGVLDGEGRPLPEFC